MQKREPKTLRPYQIERVDEIVRLFRKHDRVRISMACGSGKTEVAQAVIARLKAKRVLVVTSGRDLATQLDARFEDARGLEIPKAAIVTVRPYHESTTRFAAQHEWDLVVLDEGHRVNPKAVTLQPMTGFGNDKRPNLAPVKSKRWLLMTATDGKVSGDDAVYGVPATPFSPREAVEAKAIVPLVVVVQRAEALDSKDEDHSEWIIEAMAARPKMRAIVFHRTILASEMLHASLKKAEKVRSAHISSKVGKGEIEAALAALKDGSIDLITNPNKISEGVDVPAVKAVFMTAPTRSDIWAVQRAGRTQRLSPGETEGLVFLPAKASADGTGLDKADKRYAELIRMLQDLVDAGVVTMDDIRLEGFGSKLDVAAAKRDLDAHVRGDADWWESLAVASGAILASGGMPKIGTKERAWLDGQAQAENGNLRRRLTDEQRHALDALPVSWRAKKQVRWDVTVIPGWDDPLVTHAEVERRAKKIFGQAVLEGSAAQKRKRLGIVVTRATAVAAGGRRTRATLMADPGRLARRNQAIGRANRGEAVLSIDSAGRLEVFTHGSGAARAVGGHAVAIARCCAGKQKVSAQRRWYRLDDAYEHGDHRARPGEPSPSLADIRSEIDQWRSQQERS